MNTSLNQAKIGLIGHSHSIPLLDALGDWRKQATAQLGRIEPEWLQTWLGRPFRVHPSGSAFPAPREVVACLIDGRLNTMSDTTHTALAPWFMERVDELAEVELLISTLFGNDTVDLQLMDNLPAYDFAGAEGSSTLSWANPQYQPIDRIHILETLRLRSAHVIWTVGGMAQRLDSVPVVHILPPPPLETPWGARGELADLIAQHGLVRANLRLKWHSAYCAYVESALSSSGIRVLCPPARARTEDGFLKDELALDLTHGNGLYSAMLWEDLNRMFG